MAVRTWVRLLRLESSMLKPVAVLRTLVFSIPLLCAIILASIFIESQLWFIVVLSMIFILNAIWWEHAGAFWRKGEE